MLKLVKLSENSKLNFSIKLKAKDCLCFFRVLFPIHTETLTHTHSELGFSEFVILVIYFDLVIILNDV